MAEKKAKENPKFEDALERLELLVEEMESGDLSLEDMMKHFEEGSVLVKLCDKKLNEVEKRIEKLVEKDGDISTEPFDESEIGAE